ncbi:MAG: BON domain-containing protein [Burkholderiales bacterium]|nr:BON domain-containing protein [Burkholderiales bacterium]
MMRYVFFFVIAALPFVKGCAPLIVGGAAATGVMVAEDRRTVGTMTEDQGIETKAASRITDSVKGDIHLNVTSYNRAVLLSGEVPSAAVKEQAGRIARAVENVRAVYNELAVGPVTPLSSRANDSVTTSKVKGRFVDAQKFNPIHVKVVTENGVVYLLGMVKRQEAADATEITRTTSGVTRVVRLFEYLD